MDGTPVLDALGYQNHLFPISGPQYCHSMMVRIWDGTSARSMVMHRPMSLSLLSSTILQCDPDVLFRYSSFFMVSKESLKTIYSPDNICTSWGLAYEFNILNVIDGDIL